MIPEVAVEAAWATFWDVPQVATSNVTKREVRLALEAAAPHMLTDAQTVAWDRAVGSMVYDDGTPVEIMSNANPYRTTK